VTVGSGSVAEAKAAAQSVCTQVLMLNGTLDLSNDLVGSRTADVTNVAFNRTLDAGISVKKVCACVCADVSGPVSVARLRTTQLAV
jgi:hypothetical protein